MKAPIIVTSILLGLALAATPALAQQGPSDDKQGKKPWWKFWD